MKIFTESFGQRLWGVSTVLWIIAIINQVYIAPLWWKVLALVVYLYFLTFGTSRFDGVYKKLF